MSLESNFERLHVGGHPDEIVTFFCTQRHNVTSQNGVLMTFGSTGWLPGRWLLHSLVL